MRRKPPESAEHRTGDAPPPDATLRHNYTATIHCCSVHVNEVETDFDTGRNNGNYGAPVSSSGGVEHNGR